MEKWLRLYFSARYEQRVPFPAPGAPDIALACKII